MKINNILPECQAEFRRSRSCTDNIFILNSIIQIHLRLKARKVFVAFVDFKSAFDTINHNLLWQKLYNSGISAKFIRIFKSLYSNATMKLKSNSYFTKTYEIVEGVLQGESLSPLLFSIFIADMQSYFYSFGLNGINVDNYISVLLLFFADDLVILADSEIDLNRKYTLYLHCLSCLSTLGEILLPIIINEIWSP